MPDSIVQGFFKDKEFADLPHEKKSAIIGNYFSREYGDDEFFSLPAERQTSITNKFISEHLEEDAPFTEEQFQAGEKAFKETRKEPGLGLSSTPTWGQVIGQTLTAGVANVDASLFRSAKDIYNASRNLLPGEAVKKLLGVQYHPEIDESVNKAFDAGIKWAQDISEQQSISEDLDPLPWYHPKKITGTGLEAMPQIATVVAGALSGGTLAASTALGLIAYGGAAEEAKSEGANQVQQVLHGITAAEWEVITELPVFKAVGNVWKTLKGAKVADDVAQDFSKRLLKGLGFYSAGVAGEAGQEALSYAGGQVSKQIFYDPEAEISLKDALKSAYGGFAMALMTGLFGAPMGVARLASGGKQEIDYKDEAPPGAEDPRPKIVLDELKAGLESGKLTKEQVAGWAKSEDAVSMGITDQINELLIDKEAEGPLVPDFDTIEKGIELKPQPMPEDPRIVGPKLADLDRLVRESVEGKYVQPKKEEQPESEVQKIGRELEETRARIAEQKKLLKPQLERERGARIGMQSELLKQQLEIERGAQVTPEEKEQLPALPKGQGVELVEPTVEPETILRKKQKSTLREDNAEDVTAKPQPEEEKTIPTKIIELTLDQSAANVPDINLDSEEISGAMLIYGVLHKHLSRHIDTLAGKTRFTSKDSLPAITKIINKNINFYVRKWESKEERQGAIKAFNYLKTKYAEITKPQPEQTHPKAINLNLTKEEQAVLDKISEAKNISKIEILPIKLKSGKDAFTIAETKKDGTVVEGHKNVKAEFLKRMLRKWVRAKIDPNDPNSLRWIDITKETQPTAVEDATESTKDVEPIPGVGGEDVPTAKSGNVGVNIFGNDVYEDEGGRYVIERSGETDFKSRATRQLGAKGEKIPSSSAQSLYMQGNKTYLTKEELDAFEGKDARSSKQDKPTKEAKVYGESNKVFTKDAADKARELLRKKLNQVNVGIDPEIVQAGIQLAGYHIEAGARSFSDYTKSMVEDLGEIVRPYLRGWYEAVRLYPGFDATGMTNYEDIPLTKDTQEVILKEEEEVQDETVRRASTGTPEGKRAGEIQPAKEARGADEVLPTQGRPGSEGERKPAKSRVAGLRSGGSRSKGPSDYTITSDDHLGQGGQKQKFHDNIEAIRLLEKIGDRQATPEEQSILVKYVGWGGIPQAFYQPGGRVSSGWETEAKELKGLLSNADYNPARRSTQDAHYTNQTIIDGIYKGLARLGFTRGGKILEPSVGTGNFIGLMPTKIRNASQITGIELDPLTSTIATKLYPKQNIVHSGFENVSLTPNSYDAAIGNPPFGSQSLFDAENRALKKFSIHNFFFAKSILALRPNGVLAMVVSSSMMDKIGDTQRTWIRQKAELLGAIRLPNNVFRKTAGTDVTTDIIFLRKREKGEKVTGHKWQGVKEVPGENNRWRINEYFAANPHMMLGTLAPNKLFPGEIVKGLYNAVPGLIANEGVDIAAALEEAIGNLPQNVFVEGQTIEEVQQADILVSKPGVARPYGYALDDEGRAVRRLPDKNGEQRYELALYGGEPVTGQRLERFKGLLGLREAIRKLITAEVADDPKMKEYRKFLNSKYDLFVKKFGYISSQINSQVLANDPTDLPLLRSLETDYDKGISKAVSKTTGKDQRPPSAKKATIFTKRVRVPYREAKTAENAKDGLAIVLREDGYISIPRISELVGKSEEDIEKDLRGVIYKNPESEIWETASVYLSGNVKQKLREAKQAAVENAEFASNVEELEKVQPKDVPAELISFRVGATWLPSDIYENFASEILNSPMSIQHLTEVGKWITQIRSTGASEYDTGRLSAAQLFEKMITGRPIALYTRDDNDNRVLDRESTEEANAKAKQIDSRFQEWALFHPTHRETITQSFNDNVNTTVEPTFDGSHMIFPGMGVINANVERDNQLRPHQGNAVWRLIQQGKGLLDHVVGSGKTYVAIATGLELKRMGLLKKPMYVVPNHLVAQWTKDFQTLYPGSNVLAIGKKDFSKKNRQEFLARIATGEWDAVLIAHSSFGFIKTPVDYTVGFYQEQISQLEEAIVVMRETEGRRSFTVKNMENAKDRLETKMRTLAGSVKEDVVDFSELGVDGLFIDEAHEFKNLFYTTTKSRVAGLGNPTGSQKAFDMFVKTQYIQEKNNNKGVFFLTGTPVSNSISEMFTMMRYLSYGKLKELGMAHFDQWANTFASTESDWEVDPTGTRYRLQAKLEFINLPGMLSLYKSFADIISNENLKEMSKESGKRWPIPEIEGGKPELVVAERSDLQKNFSEWIINRFDNMPSDPRIDNPLKATGEAMKAALDIRLIHPDLPDHPGSKVNLAVKNIFDIYKEWGPKKGAQLVFCDLSVPKKSRGKHAKEIKALQDERKRLESLLEKTHDDEKTKEIEAAYVKVSEKFEKYSPMELIAATSKFSVYDDVKSKLIKQGIPADQIAFIHDANTDAQKDVLFESVRAGRIRVLIGSTSKMGAGMNVQNKLVALHHLDAPWKPSELEQREGRIIRQGNEFFYESLVTGKPFKIRILRYSTKETLDTRRWQIIESKAHNIEQLRTGDLEWGEKMEDAAGDAANAAEMKAASSGNPLILEEIQVRKEIDKTEMMRRSEAGRRYRLEAQVRTAKTLKERLPGKIKTLKEFAERVANNPKDRTPEGWKIAIDGKEYKAKGLMAIPEVTTSTDKKVIKENKKAIKEAEEHNKKALETARKAYSKAILAKIRPYNISWKKTLEGPTITYRGEEWICEAGFKDRVLYLTMSGYDFSLVYDLGTQAFSPEGFMVRADNALDTGRERVADNIEGLKKENETAQQKSAVAQEELKKPTTDYDATLQTLREQHGSILSRLQVETRGQGEVDFSMWTEDNVAQAYERIKGHLGSQRGSFSLKKQEGPAIYEDLMVVAKDIIGKGANTYSKFAARMKKAFGDLWDKIKNVMPKLFADAKKLLKDERGMVGRDIPKFKSSNEAIDFGRTATPEQITELKKLSKESDKRYAEVKAKAESFPEKSKERRAAIQEMVNESAVGQFYREAYQSAEGAEWLDDVHPTLREKGQDYEQEAYKSKKEADNAILKTAATVERVSNRTVSDSLRKYKSGIAKELLKQRRVDFTGRKLTKGNERRELIELLQVYRTPRLENLIVVYRSKEGEILGHNVITSGQLQYVAPKNLSKYAHKINKAARKMKADHVDLVHNHPGGDPSMSPQDKAFAKYLYNRIDKLDTFAVINHEQFTYLEWRKREPLVKWDSYVRNPEHGNWIHKKKTRIMSPKDMAAFAREQNIIEGKMSIVYLDGSSHIKGWSLHNDTFLDKPYEEIRKSVVQQSRAHDSSRAVFITDKALPDTFSKQKAGSWLLDVITTKGESFRQGHQGGIFLIPVEGEKGFKKSIMARSLHEGDQEYKADLTFKEFLAGIENKKEGRSVELNDNPSSPEGFNLPTEGKGRQVFDFIQWKLQDRLNSLKKVQTAIEKEKKTELTDEVNVYQVEEAYISKASTRIRDFERTHLEPLTEKIAKSKHDLEDVELFLYARHATEANQRLEDINPNVEENTALSGMDNQEAATILNKYSQDVKMQEIAQMVDEITAGTRSTLIESGLATADEIGAWEKAYEFYVPLRREGKPDTLPKKGKGADVGGPESKKRLTGSAERRAVNILSNIVAQHEATLIRAEKAVVGRSLYQLAKENPNKAVWEVDSPETKPFLKQRKEVDPETGLPVNLSEVVFGRDILYKFKDNVFVVKIDGEEHTVTFNEQNVQSQRIVRAMKNLGADSSSAVVNILSTINRYLAIINTSANPEFIFSNFTRDVQAAGYNINSVEAKGLKRAIFKDIPKALLGARRGVRGKYDTEWSKLYSEFEVGGGQTGWVEYYKNIEKREKKLKNMLKRHKPGAWSTTKNTIRSVFDFVSNENMAVENAVRLAVFAHLKDKIGTPKAISAAKNITVNFTRKGDIGSTLNAFYLFFGASIQGNARLFQALTKSPTARKMAYGTIAFAVVLDMTNRLIGGEDDDGENYYDKVEPWLKEHNLIIMRPGGDYFKLPLPWGYNVLHVLGQVMGEAVDPNYKGKFSAIKSATRVGSAVMGSFNPLGSESTFLQLIAPTVIDPFVQWGENKKFYGAPVKPKQMPFDVPKPEYQLYWQGARGASKWITKQLNNLTGGDEIIPGTINLSPEIVDIFLDTGLGGAGKFIDNTVSLPKTLKEKRVEVRKIPFARRAYGQPSEYYTRTKFYDNLSEIRYAEKALLHYHDTPKQDEVEDRYKKEKELIGRANGARRYINRINQGIKKTEQHKDLSRIEKNLEIEKREKAVHDEMVRFNKEYLKKMGVK